MARKKRYERVELTGEAELRDPQLQDIIFRHRADVRSATVGANTDLLLLKTRPLHLEEYSAAIGEQKYYTEEGPGVVMPSFGRCAALTSFRTSFDIPRV